MHHLRIFFETPVAALDETNPTQKLERNPRRGAIQPCHRHDPVLAHNFNSTAIFWCAGEQSDFGSLVSPSTSGAVVERGIVFVVLEVHMVLGLMVGEAYCEMTNGVVIKEKKEEK